MAEVRVETITKTFGRVVAVNYVSLHIPDGQFVILLGPSGCGKTTLLRLLAGLEEVSSGTIWIGGTDVTYLHPRERDIAMVFQSYALYPHMSVRRNLTFALELRGVPADEIQRRLDRAAGILGIAELLDRQPKQLSGGQRQRVALGRAIVREPAVFLFDEPLSNLDAKLRTAMRSELIKLHQRLGSTIVYVTHDQVEAMTMGETVVVMRDGVVQQQGAPMDIYNDPQNLFVAEFIGSPAMNILPGRLDGDGAAVLGGGAWRLELGRARTAGVATAGHDLRFGIRPEHLAMEQPTGQPRRYQAVQGTVEVVEPLGPETIVEVDVAGSSLTARVKGDHLPVHGTAVTLYADLDRVYVFDGASGARLGGGAAAS
jgi:multiple sugar transport system ATP-binding protein